MIQHCSASTVGRASYAECDATKNGGQQNAGPHFERSILRVRRQATAYSSFFAFACWPCSLQLRQLSTILFRVLLERGWAVRAAEVNLLAFVFDGMLWIDRLAAHRAHRLTREALLESCIGEQHLQLFFVAGFLRIWLHTYRSRSRPWSCRPRPCGPCSPACR